jgi:hypothetical protein
MIIKKLRQNKKSAVDYEEVKNNIENAGYKLLSEYKNMKTKLEIECNKNHKYKVTYEKFLRGDRCPICCQSKGEERIQNYLTNKNIKFKPQFRFKDCRVKYPLPFDFAVFNNDNNINCLIEFDGIQHYQHIPKYGTKEDFEIKQQYDNVKNEYCLKNNIKLIRIPYWDFNNIETIINGAGITRGLSQASANGVHVARTITKRIRLN